MYRKLIFYMVQYSGIETIKKLT